MDGMIHKNNINITNIKSIVSQYNQIHYDYLKAAWVCDDHKLINRSIEFRKLAINTLTQMMKMNDKYGNDKQSHVPIDIEIVMLDILRRANMFDQCKIQCNLTLQRLTAENIVSDKKNDQFDTFTSIINYQFKLCQSKNRKKYTVYEALNNLDPHQIDEVVEKVGEQNFGNNYDPNIYEFDSEPSAMEFYDKFLYAFVTCIVFVLACCCKSIAKICKMTRQKIGLCYTRLFGKLKS